RVHPTVLMGKFIGRGIGVAKGRSARLQKVYGVGLALGTITFFAGTSYLLLWVVSILGEPVQIVCAALLLKPTFSIQLMHTYALKLASAVRRGDWEEAKAVLRHIVRRDPNSLSESQIISAGVESVAESTTDGITSPLFFYALFGVPGAVAYRAINTLDSMLGYRDPQFINIGWFSAKLDSIANWLPTRLTAILTIVSAALIGQSAAGALQILRRDRNRTASWNAGWVMSAMAGALRVQLEKQGSYVLGNRDQELAPNHIVRATRILVMNTVLFTIFFVLPIMLGVERASRIIGH
ncbi:MAG TPA: adenosylcobinamide-phosphate synthase CbiB, partial [Candidatus Bathyarchaeia archaeon]|nr:adenosylcobinamide-phosphate synthase CbiB [Candidatus Bathyarchaeia archaeon]